MGVRGVDKYPNERVMLKEWYSIPPAQQNPSQIFGLIKHYLENKDMKK